MTLPCLDSQVYLNFITSSISRWNKCNTISLTDLKAGEKGENDFCLFPNGCSFLIAPDTSAEMLKILEQNVQNVLELYFILGCQAHWVCITKHWNNKKQVPCQVSFIIRKLRVDVFCKKCWQNNPKWMHQCLYYTLNEIQIGVGGWGYSTLEYSRQQNRLIILFMICKKSFFF